VKGIGGRSGAGSVLASPRESRSRADRQSFVRLLIRSSLTRRPGLISSTLAALVARGGNGGVPKVEQPEARGTTEREAGTGWLRAAGSERSSRCRNLRTAPSREFIVHLRSREDSRGGRSGRILQRSASALDRGRLLEKRKIGGKNCKLSVQSSLRSSLSIECRCR